MLDKNLNHITYITFLIWLYIGNLDDHFGYDFPWMCSKAFPFSATDTFHNYHHLANIGNYSAHTMLWDSIFGTCSNYVKHLDEQDELKKDKGEMTRIKLKAD